MGEHAGQRAQRALAGFAHGGRERGPLRGGERGQVQQHAVGGLVPQGGVEGMAAQGFGEGEAPVFVAVDGDTQRLGVGQRFGIVRRRGEGIGEALMRALMQYAANMGVQYMTLEVRKTNLIAQALYRKLHFIQLGVRKRYYEDNGEDALLYVCQEMPEAKENFTEEE